MAIPTINTFSVDENRIQLYWQASPKSNVKKWNVYGSPGVTVDFIPPEKGAVLGGGAYPENAFVLLDSGKGVANRDTALTPGSVLASFTREELGISGESPYYFTIMPVDADGNEIGTMNASNIHAVPFRDAYFVDEAGQPINMVYKSFEFDLWPLVDWDPERYLNVTSLLGRPAKNIKIDAVGDNCWVRFNSLANDAISIRYSSTFQYDACERGLRIDKIYIHNPSVNDITVRIWVYA